MSQDKSAALDNASKPLVKQHLTEEVFDLFVTRPIAARIVQVLIPTPVTANQVTALGAILGVLAGILLAQKSATGCGWAAVCLLCCMVLDCADGQLARARGGGSHFGRMLDGASDYALGIALHLGMFSYLAAEGVLFRSYLLDGWGLFAWIVLAGASMVLHCGVFDYRKQWFFAHLEKKSEETNTLTELTREVNELDNPIVKGFLAIYLFYHRFQNDIDHGEKDTCITPLTDHQAREHFQDKCAGFMRAASFLGPTSHNVLILLATVASPFFPEAFWWYILTAVVPMNLLFLTLLIWGQRLDKTFAQVSSE